VPEIDEVVLSLNYQPGRIEEVFGDGAAAGVRLEYMVEPTPLGTGGAIKFAAGRYRDEPLVVFNGDVLTAVDLPAVIALHRERRAKATIVLTPVENPSAYGLVETDGDGNVKQFLEKPSADEIRCDTINAGIYVLEPETLSRIPGEIAFSIERGYFPSLVADRETFIAYTYRGYWIDIGTPDKYRQAHTDIMDGRLRARPFASGSREPVVSPSARIDPEATIEGPCFIDANAIVKKGARVGPYSVIGQHCHIGEKAVVDGAIIWPHTTLDEGAALGAVIAGRHCQFGRHVDVRSPAVFGDRSIVSDYTRV
jgi:NDP-sugar pyrophosphorylase family protein